MRAYPVPVRLAVLAAVDSGMSTSQAARVFGVGLPSVKLNLLGLSRPPG